MSDTSDTMSGACHCGAVRFEVRLTDGLGAASRCNCSYCRMRGAVAVPAWLANLTVIAGEDMLTRYQFGTGTASHYFCSHCGIATHHQRRSDPRQYSVNAACLEGVSPFDFNEIPVTNGQQHARDVAEDEPRQPIVGTLRYETLDPHGEA